ncbi:low molecular weight protein-tyrosine-phosphatase [Pseudogracilibacillus sp. ICA-222130]|uniref:low molecular weight protein-tyrosine-phosphatase n=1 Tax=Pseudogracilibacillus sp. ICA-222130 TaxID=3134655 RepID=UPI0030BBD9EB
MVRVLFVCLGNICRSPMAEAVFRHKVKEAGLEKKIEVDSAGTASWHTGKQPYHGTRGKLDTLHISYDGMKARQINEKDFHTFDYVLAMDEQNILDIEDMYSFDKKMLHFGKLMDVVENAKEVNVPDPYYTGNFDYTYELVSEACDALLEKIKIEHKIQG